MRTFFTLLMLFSLSCAEGSVDDGTVDGQLGGGGPADCIAGVTCPDPDCIDADGDGFGDGCFAGPDCDDNDPMAAPNRGEVCDGKDNDCDGRIDEDGACDGVSPNNNMPDNPPPPNASNPACIDADGDGYGVGCPAGGDCDDNDPERFDGAPEACDGKDNDCDGVVDEGFELGMACTAGLGVCERAGTLLCAADGTMEQCSASAGNGSAEVCDNLDNDCDGLVDEGLNCNMCIDDSNEPDNSSLTGTVVTSGSVTGQLCPGDVDWFRLGDYTVGQTVSVTVLFSHAQGDINAELYVGSTFEAGSYSGNDNESFNTTISRSGAVTMRLYYASPPGVTGNSYTVLR